MDRRQPTAPQPDSDERRPSAMLALLTLPALLAGVMLMVFTGRWASGHVDLRLLVALSEIALVLPSLVVLLLSASSGTEVGFAHGRPRHLALATVMGPTLWAFSLGLLELQYAFWKPDPSYIEGFRRLHDALRPNGPWDVPISLGAIALLPALCEEILCRGLVFSAVRRPLGTWAAVLISAGAFTVIHLDPYRWLFALSVGIALGLIRERTGTVAATMLAHGTLNALTFAVAPWFDDPSQPLPEPRPSLALLLLCVGGTTTWLLLRALQARAAATKEPQGKRRTRPSATGR
jgi:membrane protease YdiL (CAAX protease family)